jgi:hypothetical protein
MENDYGELEYNDIIYISHIQISFPYLNNWNNNYDEYIKKNINNILKNGYAGKISLEVKYDKIVNLKNINTFINFMNNL